MQYDRIKIACVDKNVLVNFLNCFSSMEFIDLKNSLDLPEDAKVLNADYDSSRRCLMVTIHSESFPEVAAGMYPEIMGELFESNVFVKKRLDTDLGFEKASEASG